MATKLGIGISTKFDSFLAGKEAAKNACNQLIRHEPDIIFAFFSPIFDQEELINGIYSILPEAPLVGCSSAGSLTHYGSYRDTVTVCAISSDSLVFTRAIGKRVSKNPRVAGSQAARKASDSKGAAKQAYIMFSDLLSGNMADLLRGAQEVFGTSFPIIGGSATDNFLYKKTYQYLDRNIYTDSVVGLLISGDIKTGTGFSHGWQPIGTLHKITKARYNIIKEIDKRSALELYEEYLGKPEDEFKKEGIAKWGALYPLGMQLKENGEYVARMPLQITEDGSLILGAEIPERESVNLMVGDKNLILKATKKACEDALESIKKYDVKFAMVFSDIARLQLLRKDAKIEVEIIKKYLGENIPFFGCYTCGEYAPSDIFEYKGQSYFHNQAISITLFAE